MSNINRFKVLSLYLIFFDVYSAIFRIYFAISTNKLAWIIYWGRRLIPLFVFGISLDNTLMSIFGVSSLIMNSFFLIYFLNGFFLHKDPWFRFGGHYWYWDVAIIYCMFYFLIYLTCYINTRDINISFNFAIQSISITSYLWEIPFWRNIAMLFHRTHPFFRINTHIIATIYLLIILWQNRVKINPLITVSAINYILFFIMILFIGSHEITRIFARMPTMFLMFTLAYSMKGNNKGVKI